MYPKQAEYRRFREKASAVCVKGCSLKERRPPFFQTDFVPFRLNSQNFGFAETGTTPQSLERNELLS